jgi:hypothetical protein
MNAAAAHLETTPNANSLWVGVQTAAPILADTCRFYVDQIAVTSRPATAKACDSNLRYFADWLIGHDPTIKGLAELKRTHIEAYKRYLGQRQTVMGTPMKASTINMRLGIIRVAIERLIEWDHPDAPMRNPIFGTDLPKMDEPLPKFLDDEQATTCKPQPNLILNVGSCAKYLSAPASESVNYANLESMRSDVSVTTTGFKFRSANSIPIDTSRYTRSCSSSSLPGRTAPDQTTPTDSSRTETVGLSTGSAFHGPLLPALETPALVTFTHTNSDTPSPPKPSTAA